jgi:hypothetical protein
LILTKLSKDFNKNLQNKFLGKSVGSGPSCSIQTDGQLDRHYKDDSRFSQHSERVYEPEISDSILAILTVAVRGFLNTCKQ